MNDKDKKALNTWFKTIEWDGHTSSMVKICEAWQAACEYKQKKSKNLENKLAIAVEFNEIWEDKCIDLESKLTIATKALEDYASVKVFTSHTAQLALLKIKDGEYGR